MGLDNDDIKALIAILQKGLQDDSNNTSTEKKPKNKKPATSKIKSKKAGSDNSENKFLDMPESKMHKEDVAFDKAVRVSPPSPRNRQFKTVDVTCRSCGKKDSINPVLLVDSVDRYKCNKCSSSAG